MAVRVGAELTLADDAPEVQVVVAERHPGRCRADFRVRGTT